MIASSSRVPKAAATGSSNDAATATTTTTPAELRSALTALWLRSAIGIIVLLALALSVAAVFEAGGGPCESGAAAVAGYMWLIAAIVGAGAAIVYAVFGSSSFLSICGGSDTQRRQTAFMEQLEASVGRSRLLYAVLAIDRVVTAVVLVLL